MTWLKNTGVQRVRNVVLQTGDVPVDNSTNPGVWVHHVKHGLKLQEAMTKLGLECSVRSPDHPENKYGSMEAFLIAKLRK